MSSQWTDDSTQNEVQGQSGGIESHFLPFCEVEEDDESPLATFEIVGLQNGSNGRSCHHHPVCGMQVVPRDILRLQKTVVETDTVGFEEVLTCIFIHEGRETCRVGFVPHALLHWDKLQGNINKHIQVVKFYKILHNSYKRSMSHHHYGMAGCIFLDEIYQIE